MPTRAARKAASKKINKATRTKGGNTIGVISYWGLDGVWVRVNELEKLFDKHGLDKDKYFPPKILGSTAFRKALREAKGDYKGFILRPIVEDDQMIVWGVVKEDIDEANVDLSYACEAKITYNKDTESVHTKGKAGDAKSLADKVATLFADLTETFVSWDLQRMLRRNIGRDMGSVTLRRGGGFYFTPPAYLSDIEKHQAVVEDLGDSDMGIIVVTEDDKHNRRTVGRDTRRSLEDGLNEVKAEIERFKAKAPRESTLQSRLESFKALKSRCDMYAGMLGIKVSDLKQGVDDCAAQVKALLGQVQAPAKKSAGKKKAELKEKAKVRRVRKVRAAS